MLPWRILHCPQSRRHAILVPEESASCSGGRFLRRSPKKFSAPGRCEKISRRCIHLLRVDCRLGCRIYAVILGGELDPTSRSSVPEDGRVGFPCHAKYGLGSHPCAPEVFLVHQQAATPSNPIISLPLVAWLLALCQVVRHRLGVISAAAATAWSGGTQGQLVIADCLARRRGVITAGLPPRRSAAAVAPPPPWCATRFRWRG